MSETQEVLTVDEAVKRDEQQVPITAEMINNPILAINTLVAVVDLAFEKGVFSDMEDVATAVRCKKLTNSFLSEVSFKESARGKIIKKIQDEDEKVHFQPDTELEPTETYVDGKLGLEINTYSIPESDVYFVVINNTITVLKEGDVIAKLGEKTFVSVSKVEEA